MKKPHLFVADGGHPDQPITEIYTRSDPHYGVFIMARTQGETDQAFARISPNGQLVIWSGGLNNSLTRHGLQAEVAFAGTRWMVKTRVEPAIGSSPLATLSQVDGAFDLGDNVKVFRAGYPAFAKIVGYDHIDEVFIVRLTTGERVEARLEQLERS